MKYIYFLNYLVQQLDFFLRKWNGVRQQSGSGASQSSLGMINPLNAKNVYWFTVWNFTNTALTVFILELDVKTWLISAWGNWLVFITHCGTGLLKARLNYQRAPYTYHCVLHFIYYFIVNDCWLWSAFPSSFRRLSIISQWFNWTEKHDIFTQCPLNPPHSLD